jgi:hypothetical protein
LSITNGLKNLFEKYNLGTVLGKSPQDYTLFRDPTTSDRSAFKMFVDDALPIALSDNRSVAAYRYFVIGTGVLRYDIFQGTFDQNDQLTASPYPNELWYIPNVPLKDAIATGQKMNQESSEAEGSFSDSEAHHGQRRDIMEVDQTRLRWLAEMSDAQSEQVAENLTLGYVTKDVSVSPAVPPFSRPNWQPLSQECGTKKAGDGDDTPHTPVVLLDTKLPKFVTSQPPKVTDETLGDLVFLKRHGPKILGVLNSVQKQKPYMGHDILKKYTEIRTNQVLGIYAKKRWN